MYTVSKAHSMASILRVNSTTPLKSTFCSYPCSFPFLLKFSQNCTFPSKLWISDSKTRIAVALSPQTPQPKSDLQNEPKKALYGLRLVTSREPQSELSVAHAGVQLAIVGEPLSLVQRVGRAVDPEPSQSPKLGDSGIQLLGPCQGNFQEGSVDEVWMVGPLMDSIKALWLAPEEGSWRLQEASLLVVPIPEKIREGEGEEEGEMGGEKGGKKGGEEGGIKQYRTEDLIWSLYSFEWNSSGWEGKKGENGLGLSLYFPEGSALELTPSQVNCGQGLVVPTLSPPESTPKSLPSWTREQSLEEYRELKTFLVGTTVSLVAAGGTVLYFLGEPEALGPFCLGGILGILYLLRLQSRVDSLGQPSVTQDGQGESTVGKKSTVDFSAVQESNDGFWVLSLEEALVGTPDGTKRESGERFTLAELVVLAELASLAEFSLPQKTRRIIQGFRAYLGEVVSLGQQFGQLKKKMSALEKEHELLQKRVSSFMGEGENRGRIGGKKGEGEDGEEEVGLLLLRSLQVASFQQQLTGLRAKADETGMGILELEEKREKLREDLGEKQGEFLGEIGGERAARTYLSVLRWRGKWGEIGGKILRSVGVVGVLVALSWGIKEGFDWSVGELGFLALGFFMYKVAVVLGALRRD